MKRSGTESGSGHLKSGSAPLCSIYEFEIDNRRFKPWIQYSRALNCTGCLIELDISILKRLSRGTKIYGGYPELEL